MPRTAEVLVVGAGMVGTAIGARLVRAGLDVCVVDRVGPAGGTSSSGEGNILVSDKLPGADLALALRGLELWREVAAVSGDSFEFEAKGGLVVAWDTAEMEALSSLAHLQEEQGVSAELVPGDRLQEIEPELSRDLVGGVFYEQDCQVQPMLAIAAHVAEILEYGGRVVSGVEVIGAQLDSQGSICGLRTNQGDVSVGRCVVNAAGPWAAELARRFGASVPVEPRRGHVLVTEPVPPFVRHKIYEAGYVGSVHDEGPTWLCSSVVEATQSGTILIGSSREFVGFSARLNSEIVAATARRAVALLPGLGAVRLMRAYVGFRPATPDRLPIVGPDPAVQGLFHATGHEGAGIGLSEVTAELVEALVVGEAPALDLAPFALDRFASGATVPTPAPARPANDERAYDDRAYDDRAYDDQWDGQPDGSVLGVADPSYTHWEGRRRPETSVGWRWARFRRRREGAAGRGRSEPGPTSLDAPLVHFRYHGRDLAAPSGSTVAGGLLANGERSWRTTRARGQRRGLFCGIGTCFDCLVELNGDRPVRACLSPLNEGDDVGGIGPARVAPVRSPTIEGTASVDLVVVGAGPAGMAAAAAAASRGAEVVLVDGGSRLGGQFFRQPVAEGTVGPVPAAGECLPVRFHSLVGNPRIQLRLGCEVWSATTGSSGFELRLGGDEPGPVRSRALVLATGASELALPFPGWELPGVMTAGAAQALLKSQEVAAGRQVVVAGTGPFLLPVAAALSETGATVVVVEAARARLAPQALASLLEHPSKLKEAGGYGSVFMRNRVRLLTGRAVVRCEGDGEVQWAVVARLGPNWEPIAGSEQRLPADAVCASYGFVPRVELARQLDARDMASPRHPSVHVACDEMMSSSVPGLFVAGEVSGIAGAGVAEIEGELAGHAAARYLGLADYRTHSDRQKAARRLATGRAFAARLETLYPLYPGWISWLERSTVFCRCEQTSWRAVEAAVISGATSAREVRNLTRCGMGYCQGRTCGPALQLAVSALTGRPLDQVGDLHKRPVAVPVPLETVARSAPASP